MRKKKHCLRLTRLEKRVEKLERRLYARSKPTERQEKKAETAKTNGISTAQLLNEWLNGKETAHE